MRSQKGVCVASVCVTHKFESCVLWLHLDLQAHDRLRRLRKRFLTELCSVSTHVCTYCNTFQSIRHAIEPLLVTAAALGYHAHSLHALSHHVIASAP